VGDAGVTGEKIFREAEFGIVTVMIFVAFIALMASAETDFIRLQTACYELAFCSGFYLVFL
jgi:hypothetical protein